MIGLRHYAADQFARVRRAIGLRPYHDLDLPIGAIESINKSTGAEPWFVWSIQDRRRRGKTNSAMDWIVGHIARKPSEGHRNMWSACRLMN